MWVDCVMLFHLSRTDRDEYAVTFCVQRTYFEATMITICVLCILYTHRKRSWVVWFVVKILWVPVTASVKLLIIQLTLVIIFLLLTWKNLYYIVRYRFFAFKKTMRWSQNEQVEFSVFPMFLCVNLCNMCMWCCVCVKFV